MLPSRSRILAEAISIVQKTAQLTYLEANKQQTKYRVTYPEPWKLQKRSDWCFQGQRNAWKVNGRFLGIINKEIKGTSCI